MFIFLKLRLIVDELSAVFFFDFDLFIIGFFLLLRSLGGDLDVDLFDVKYNNGDVYFFCLFIAAVAVAVTGIVDEDWLAFSKMVFRNISMSFDILYCLPFSTSKLSFMSRSADSASSCMFWILMFIFSIYLNVFLLESCESSSFWDVGKWNFTSMYFGVGFWLQAITLGWSSKFR